MKPLCATVAYLVPIFAVVLEVGAKSLFFNKFNTGSHYDSRKRTADLDLNEFQDDDLYSYKRSVDDILHPYKRSMLGGTTKRSPYGLVYNQGKPIGILEPIGQTFEYASYQAPRDLGFRNTGSFKSQWFPTKRDLTNDLDTEERDHDDLEAQSAPLHTSNYANVLAKFKVNNKVKQRPYQDFMYAQQVKRDLLATEPFGDALTDDGLDSILGRKKDSSAEEVKKRGVLDLPDEKEVRIDAAQKTAAKVKRSTEKKIDQIEENLKGMMDDMSVAERDAIDPQKDENALSPSAIIKREIYFEDEDLENGLNKIGLTKDSHLERNKKEDGLARAKIAPKTLRNAKRTKVEKSVHKKIKKKAKKDSDEVGATRVAKSVAQSDANPRAIDYQTEGEEYIRKKRQTEKEGEKEDSEIMKGLESSGDLTVSGNKSPLVALSSEESEKKSQEKRNKDLEYEKRLERNIADKIKAIKEEVKREISRLKGEDEIEDPQRKKRAIRNGNLMDEESSALDPGNDIEGILEPHIRKRRDAALETNQNAVKDDTAKIEENNEEEEKSDVDASPKTSEEDSAVVNVNKNEENNAPLSPDDESLKSQGFESDLKANTEDSLLVNKRQEESFKPQLSNLTYMKRSGISLQSDVNLSEDKNNGITGEGLNSDRIEETKLVKREDKEVKAEEPKEIKKKDEEMVEKRNAEIATGDKAETDTKDELGTDAPESIVNKRDDTPIGLSDKDRASIEQIIADANSVVKRNEEVLSTEKFVMPREGVEPESLREPDEDDAARKIRSAENASVVNGDGGAAKKVASDAKTTDNAREERAAVSQPASAKTSDGGSLAKRSVGNLKSSIQELGKPVPLKSVVLQETELTKENGIEERSATTNDQQPDKNDPNFNEADAKEIDDREASRRTIRKSSNALDENVSAPKTHNPDQSNQGRRRRSLYNELVKRGARRKRDGNWRYQRSQESMGYRPEDGEVDEEDDETQDDGFDDQTSNNLNKRNAAADYEAYDQDAQDYSAYMERNKRNARRLYEDVEGDADDGYNNFLFYPNRFARRKRRSAYREGDDGGESYERFRRKRLEPQQQRLGKMRDKSSSAIDKSEMASLSEADIFGGFPQSYEGELSRFKRVKRARDPDA